MIKKRAFRIYSDRSSPADLLCKGLRVERFRAQVSPL